MNKRKDAIPEHFSSAEEAGEFWDTHSAAEYWDEMEEIEMEFDIRERTFLVPVDKRIYRRADEQAKAKHSHSNTNNQHDTGSRTSRDKIALYISSFSAASLFIPERHTETALLPL